MLRLSFARGETPRHADRGVAAAQWRGATGFPGTGFHTIEEDEVSGKKSVFDLRQMKERGEQITWLTCYDYAGPVEKENR